MRFIVIRYSISFGEDEFEYILSFFFISIILTIQYYCSIFLVVFLRRFNIVRLFILVLISWFSIVMFYLISI